MGRFKTIAFSCMCAAALYTGVSDVSKLLCISRIQQMTQEDISRALKGIHRQQLVQAWGEPDYHLCGHYGDIYNINSQGRRLVVCYDSADVVKKVIVDQGG